MSYLDRLEALERKVSEIDRRTTFDPHDIMNALVAGTAAKFAAESQRSENDTLF